MSIDKVARDIGWSCLTSAPWRSVKLPNYEKIIHHDSRGLPIRLSYIQTTYRRRLHIRVTLAEIKELRSALLRLLKNSRHCGSFFTDNSGAQRNSLHPAFSILLQQNHVDPKVSLLSFTGSLANGILEVFTKSALSVRLVAVQFKHHY